MRRFGVCYFSLLLVAIGCGTEPIGAVSDLPSQTTDTADGAEATGDQTFDSAASDDSAVDGTSVDAGDADSSSNAATESGVCSGGYCYIAPGSFLMGSPANELGRKQDEAQRAVELTYGLYVAEYEVTQGAWARLAASRTDWNAMPAHFAECGLDCPVESINWWEALHYLNALSEDAGLTPCYVFSSCNDALVGDGRTCGAVALQDDRGNIVEDAMYCDGYRLPTEAEWELSLIHI